MDFGKKLFYRMVPDGVRGVVVVLLFSHIYRLFSGIHGDASWVVPLYARHGDHGFILVADMGI